MESDVGWLPDGVLPSGVGWWRIAERWCVMKAGDLVRLVKMADDPNPVPAGTLGTVLSVNRIGSGRESWDQVDVEWDNGRSLMLAIPPDAVEVLKNVRSQRA